MKTALILATVVALSACASQASKEAAQVVKSADERMVATCTMLGEVHGSSGWGNLAASKGMQNARDEARDNAEELGATHIVWVTVAGGYSPFAIGRAYRCP